MSDFESKIKELNLTAPRVTPEHIESVIHSCHYFTAAEGVSGRAVALGQATSTKDAGNNPLKLLTFCVLVLDNGYTVVGKSACASPENFNSELGEQIALKDAKAQIWNLEGYLLKQRLHNEGK